LQHIERKINGVFNTTFNLNLTSNALASRKVFIDSLKEHIPGVLKGENCESPQMIIHKIEGLIRKLRLFISFSF